MNKPILIIIILVVAAGTMLYTPKMHTAKDMWENESVWSCFDWQDNDNDNTLDLNDEDCYGVAELDWDNDGWINVMEYEAGTGINDSNSYPNEQ